jgi:uncharacterized protein (DUF58 family)
MPYSVERRRIYILPTRFGLMLAALLVAMLIAGLNYGSNLALGFAFLMASLAIVTMHHCHRNLLDLTVEADSAADGFALDSAVLKFRIINPARFDRYDLEIRCGDADPCVFASAADSTQALSVALPAPLRGVMRLPQWELRTRYPFGWFRAWTYVQSPIEVFIAPSPRGERALPSSAAGAAGPRTDGRADGEEEFAGLRAYRPGDALKHMAWKVLARGQDPAVRQYGDLSASPEWIDWEYLPGVDAEKRLQQLCRWILESDAQGRKFGLRIPGTTIDPATGPSHRRACLRALAAFT